MRVEPGFHPIPVLDVVDQDGRVRHPSTARIITATVGSVFALFLVGRGVAEFFVVRFSDPASYRHDWGGPTLVGVFAVHSGPALVIVAATAVVLWRRWRRAQTGPGHKAP